MIDMLSQYLPHSSISFSTTPSTTLILVLLNQQRTFGSCRNELAIRHI